MRRKKTEGKSGRRAGRGDGDGDERRQGGGGGVTGGSHGETTHNSLEISFQLIPVNINILCK